MKTCNECFQLHPSNKLAKCQNCSIRICPACRENCSFCMNSICVACVHDHEMFMIKSLIITMGKKKTMQAVNRCFMCAK